jgi:hypothetical protein
MDYQIRIRDLAFWFIALALMFAALYSMPYLALLDFFADACGVGFMTPNNGGFYINLTCEG